MTRRRALRWIGWAALGLLITAPASAQPSQVEVCLAAKGLTDKIVAESRMRIASVAQRHGASLGAPDCCFEDRCLEQAHRERGLVGMVGVELLRFGPLVRISVRAFDMRRGGEIQIRKSRASAKGFPGSAGNLERDLGEILEVLGARERSVAQQPTQQPVGPVARTEPDSGVVTPPVAGPRRPKESDVAGSVSGSGGILSIGPSPGADRIGQVEAIAERRSTMHWVGGSLLAGGGIALATGIGLLAGPMRTALDERNWARDAWLASTDPDSVERYRSQMLAQDDKARRYYLAGWITTGLGAGLAAAGLVTLLLTPTLPEDAPLALVSPRPRLQPMFQPTCAGLLLELPW